MHDVALALSCAAAVGTLLLAVQALALRLHLRRRPRAPVHAPPVSILKPLCGVDDGLAANLATFAALDYPRYEVVLGIASVDDPAWRIARDAARRWPDRFRVVLQQGEPGLNPKVNQLITLARAALHDVLVVSDSNVRVGTGYLPEIAALLEDGRIGLVTHAVGGVGDRTVGAVLDNLHLAGTVAPGVVAAKWLARRDIVIGKSMAFRRADLVALGGFEAVKDVLAEDYVMGTLVSTALGKRVAVATQPVFNVSERRTVREFAARYRRWAVLQRQAAGPLPYAAMVLLNPVLLATAALGLDPTPRGAAALGATCAARALLDAVAAGALRAGGWGVARLALSPVKDLVFGSCWAYGLVRREVNWRGNRLVVRRGTRIERPAPAVNAAAQPEVLS